MVTFRKYAANIMADSMRVQINDCGLLEFKEVDNQVYRPTWDVDYQLLYIVEGVGHFYFDSGHVAVPAGSAVLYAPGETQKYGYKKEESALVWFCHFKGEGIKALFADCPIPTSTPIGLEGLPELSTHFSGLIPSNMDPCGMAGAAITLLSLLQQISGHITQSEPVREDPLAPVFADIRENYMHDRSIEEYAAMCHLSKYHFLRLFKQKAGVTPVVYRNAYRLTVAEQLLAHSNLTVEAVAETVGFSSAAYFCRVYKKSRGHTCRQK